MNISKQKILKLILDKFEQQGFTTIHGSNSYTLAMIMSDVIDQFNKHLENKIQTSSNFYIDLEDKSTWYRFLEFAYKDLGFYRVLDKPKTNKYETIVLSKPIEEIDIPYLNISNLELFYDDRELTQSTNNQDLDYALIPSKDKCTLYIYEDLDFSREVYLKVYFHDCEDNKLDFNEMSQIKSIIRTKLQNI